jgi:hypothetical protein
MKFRITRLRVALAVAAAGSAVLAGVALATVVVTVHADTNTVREKIAQNEFTPSPDQPIFTPGWHIHPGLAVVQVQEGKLTIYQHCKTFQLHRGDTYIETPFVPVNAVSKTHTVWTTTFILANSAPATPDRSPVAEPSCPSGDND